MPAKIDEFDQGKTGELSSSTIPTLPELNLFAP
jgi:hypothetical protein